MQTAMAQPAPVPSYGGAMPLPVRRKPIANPGIAVRPPPGQYNDQQMGHSRTRTTSSGIFPVASNTTTSTMHSQYPQYPSQYQSSLRRTPTSSTSSTTGTPNRSNSGALRRSSSTRSGTAPSSYVALMRKQKATVWCDRAQFEDPRVQAQQRQARMRANMEVAGGKNTPARGPSGSSSMAAGVRSKVRHHGAPKATLYAPTTYTGTGVPMRLSASEVDEGDDDDSGSIGGQYHHRSGSGRSSLGSGRRISYANPAGRISSNSTPPQDSSPGELGDLAEEPTPNQNYESNGYFEKTKTNLSTGSGSSEERNFGAVAPMKSLPKPEGTKNSDLMRKGSVDERTTTMSNTRLFIANPDADSD
ncbi:hypothetical protein E8E13_003139 [Curvularia kusanoi]|uniref:Uncharacterized protein n=1 Tax=Curvularia kusanoi TaxID=90978 RepID=A0A9P4W765_CURKU|nr:hypothetical protein E8E13_003139 [Curvularia kusanoi]